MALVFWVGAQSWLLGWLAASLLAAGLVGARACCSVAAGAPDLRTRRRVRSRPRACRGDAVVGLFVVPAPHQRRRARRRLAAGSRAIARRSGRLHRGGRAAHGATVAAGRRRAHAGDPVLVAMRERRPANAPACSRSNTRRCCTDPARAADLAAHLERNDRRTGSGRGAARQPRAARADQRPRRVAARRDLPGSYARRGAMLGYVLGRRPAQVRLVLRDEDLLRVRGRVQSVEVRLADRPGRPPPACAARPRPPPGSCRRGARRSPWRPDAGRSRRRRTACARRRRCSCSTCGAAAARRPRIGGRAWVKLVLPSEPLGLQALRVLRQMLVRQFSPTGQA
jgi:putative peptide zinc metalloprotease protein